MLSWVKKSWCVLRRRTAVLACCADMTANLTYMSVDIVGIVHEIHVMFQNIHMRDVQIMYSRRIAIRARGHYGYGYTRTVLISTYSVAYQVDPLSIAMYIGRYCSSSV